MLAGCSSLVSPRHRLRSKEFTRFEPSHFQLSSMTTHNLNLPRTFSHKDPSTRSVPLSVEKSKPKLKQKPKPAVKGSLKQTIRRPLQAETLKTGIKRFADDPPLARAKRKRRNTQNSGDFPLDSDSGTFWYDPWRWTEITELEEKDVIGENTQGPARSSSSTSQSRSYEKTSAQETINGSSSSPKFINQEKHTSTNDGEEESQEFELVTLLLGCVEAITSKNMEDTNQFLAKLGNTASPTGTSPVFRLASYFTEALALRAARIWPHIFHVVSRRDIYNKDDEDDDGTADRILNQASPIPKFIHFTSNEILLRAFQGKDRIHIIDFSIKQGLQWPSLFQSLASRSDPPSHVRVTGIGESKKALNETGDRLAGFADALNLSFEFHPIVDRLEDIRLWMLHVKETESVGVNCAFQLHKALYDENGAALKGLLGLIRSTNPSVVVTAEQEAEHNDPDLESRVCKSLKYYSAKFDLIDSSLPLESQGRVKIEGIWGREIREIVGYEGRERLERHEGFEKWKKEMQKAGFGCVGISEREILQSKMLLKMYSCENIKVEKDESGEGGLTLSWLDQSLYTVSGWATSNVFRPS